MDETQSVGTGSSDSQLDKGGAAVRASEDPPELAAQQPKHDSVIPALEDGPDPDEPGASGPPQ